jgi:uncharacterized protein with HEPN domain
MENDAVCLVRMRERMVRIERYVAGGRGAFMSSTITQDAVLWNLELFCAAATRVSDDFKEKHRQVNWGYVCGRFRDVTRDPWHPEPENIWACIERELPAIRENLAAIMRPTTGGY